MEVRFYELCQGLAGTAPPGDPYPLQNEAFGRFIDTVGKNRFGVHIGVHERDKVVQIGTNW